MVKTLLSLVVALLSTTVNAVLIQAGGGISFNGQATADGHAVITVTAPAGTTWVGIGFGKNMWESQLHMMWNTGSQFVISDRYGDRAAHTASFNPSNPNQLQLLSGTGVDASGNWNVVFSRPLEGLGVAPGEALNFMWAVKSGGAVVTSADPSVSLGIHSSYGRLSGTSDWYLLYLFHFFFWFYLLFILFIIFTDPAPVPVANIPVATSDPPPPAAAPVETVAPPPPQPKAKTAAELKPVFIGVPEGGKANAGLCLVALTLAMSVYVCV
ncbi:hypothetical protein BDR26DRAFT_860205 [Obelidium mucronatum]|nr:hypothetical protein BDR26DRAFT_860205 [Obelidium mucronatum]